MICIDMNTGGEDSAGSDHRTYRYYVVHAHFLPFLVALGQIRAHFGYLKTYSKIYVFLDSGTLNEIAINLC